MAFRNNLADVRLIMNCLDSIKKVKSTNIIWHLPGQKFWISAIYCSAIGHIKLFCKRDKFPHSLRLKFRAPDSRRSYIVELEIWVPALSTRHSALITQHPALSTHHSALSTHHPALSTQHSALTTRHSALSTQHSALTTQHSPPSTQHSPLSTQHSALSTQHSALTTHHPALSTQHSPLSTRHHKETHK